MAIYYCRTDGNNLNSGTGYTSSEAFATLAKAISVVSFGDTVRIAPQTFYETMTLATSGNSGATINWWGDKEAQYFLDLKPGPCRITGCNSGTSIGEATRVIQTNAKTYNNFYSLVIDGVVALTAAVYTIYCNSTNINIYDCVISSGVAAIFSTTIANAVNVYRCLLVGTTSYSSYNNNTYNCISVGSGFMYGISENCVVIGAMNRCFYLINAKNCTAIGGSTYGFQNTTAGLDITFTNCVAIGCITAFGQSAVNSGTITLNNCKSVNCTNILLNNNNAGNVVNLDTTSYCGSLANIGAVGTWTGTPTETAYEGYTDISRIMKIATAFKFDIFTQTTGSAVTFLEDYDILGHPKNMGDGGEHIGAFEYSQVDLEWTTYKTVAPAIKISRAGQKRLTIAVKAGVPKTVGCWVYFSGSTLPQIIAHSNEDILTITSGYTATAIGSELTWEQLSLTFTPKASGFLQLSLYARDTVTGSFTIFSDFSL